MPNLAEVKVHTIHCSPIIHPAADCILVFYSFKLPFLNNNDILIIIERLDFRESEG